VKIKDLFAEGNPFDFAEPVVKFKKLDDLPKKPNSTAGVDKAMKALHKMVHAQAHAYGGKHGKLLPVGIAEIKIRPKRDNSAFMAAYNASTEPHPFDRKMRLWQDDVGLGVSDFAGGDQP